MLGHGRAVLGIAVLAALFSGGAGAAQADTSDVQVFANPDSVGVGQVTSVTATGLGGLETAGFGLGSPTGASLSSDASTYGPSAEVQVNDGTALVFFKANQPGTYTVDVTDGETPLGETTITVTDSAPDTGTQLTASPSSISTGGSATITATGLGDLQTAEFGLGGDANDAELDPTEATVTDGTATTTFTASEPGTYTVDVTDGETPLATVEVTVTAASPSPTPTVATPTPSPSPSPTPTDDGVPAAVIWTVVIAVLVVAAVIVAAVIVVRRRNGTDTTPPA